MLLYTHRILFSLLLLFSFTTTFAQLNMTLRSHLSYGDLKLNDVWGWQDPPTGKEYALVGTREGVSIVDVSDPDNAEEKVFLPGAESTWRDLKTWGNYAYVTNEEANGIEVIYLGDLAETGEVSSYNWVPVLPTGDTLETCHNLYIDEFGYCYLSGCNPINNGGVIIIDVFSEPGSPQFVSFADATRSHDAYARDNILYSSEISAGVFTIFDVTDKQNIVELGSSPTLFNFTHNTWLSDDGNFLFTTDEKANASVGSYNVADPSDIEALDNFRPLATLGTGVIPHNVHVHQDWLVVSYYTAGGIIIDASDPENMVEVGNYDTFTGTGQGFKGCWGAYPFLPSGNILLSDINTGLWVLTPNYVHAARLEGSVTAANTGAAIAFASITIETSIANETTTNFTGEYKTGLAEGGTYQVTYDAPGYKPLTIETTLVNGETLLQDVELDESDKYKLSGTAIDQATGEIIPYAHVLATDGFFEYTTQANENGVFIFEEIFEDEYTVLVVNWGHEYTTQELNLNQDTDITIELPRGYRDDFRFDLEWETTSTAESGDWVREVPITTYLEGSFAGARVDRAGDYGDICFLTGNEGGEPENSDLDNGTIRLISPPMDLSDYEVPFARCWYWFFNKAPGDSFDPNDAMTFILDDGTEEITLFEQFDSNSFWKLAGFNIKDFTDNLENVRLIIEMNSEDSADYVTKGGLDFFRITEGNTLATEHADDLDFHFHISPNPFNTSAKADINIVSAFKKANIRIFSQIGILLDTHTITEAENSIILGQELPRGTYFITLEIDGKIVKTERILKLP